jgi:hypothetical protein
MSAVYFVQEADRGVAFWHADDDAPGVYCCGVDLRAYNDTQAVRDCFAALVAAVAAHCRSRFTAEVAAPTSRLAGLPCEGQNTAYGQDRLTYSIHKRRFENLSHG